LEPTAPDRPPDATEDTRPGLGHDRQQRDATSILRTAQRFDVQVWVRRDDRILGTLGDTDELFAKLSMPGPDPRDAGGHLGRLP